MLKQDISYQQMRADFDWDIPKYYNIGVDICDKWMTDRADQIAVYDIHPDGRQDHYCFADLYRLSNQLAAVLKHKQITQGDRVAVFLPQSIETAFSHIAIYKIGAIALPLFSLFGPEALQFRLENSGTSCLITNQEGGAKIRPLLKDLPALKHLLITDQTDANPAENLYGLMADQAPDFTPVKTRADDPALIIYTSGTTGNPKGALHAHRVLLGHLPGVEMSHNFLPQADDKFWTPADWAWIGGLLDVMMPALHHGIPVVACRFQKFTGEAAFQLLQDLKIRNVFLPPTALKMMRQVSDPEKRWSYQLRSVASGGESLGSELRDWGRKIFGVTINEFYGQTECNMIVSCCDQLLQAEAGVMGQVVIGHQLAVLSENGDMCAPGETGVIAVKRPDPVMFLEYWQNPQATAEKFQGDWLLTGDQGWQDADGWFHFVGRDDDVITSSGYRIGPGEIEDCLLGHPAVQMAAVIGKPDPQRTEIIKAYIILTPDYQPDDDLLQTLQKWVKSRLAAHEYPREIEFVDQLPMTTTGKIIRKALRAQAIADDV